MKMKKILSAVLLVFAVTPLAAQSHYYHLRGDTIRDRCSTYHYQWYWEGYDGHETDSLMCNYHLGATYMLHTTDSSLRVLGIAFGFQIFSASVGGEEIFECGTEQYLRLYQATPNGPELKGQIRWTDTYKDKGAHDRRYMEIKLGLIGPGISYRPSQYCDHIYRDTTLEIPVYEYYFDSAITVTDSFYVGCTNYPVLNIVNTTIDMDQQDSLYEIGSEFQHTHRYFYHSLNQFQEEEEPPCIVQIPLQKFIGKNYWPETNLRWPWTVTAADTMWRYYEERVIPFVFPIVEIDTVGLPYDTARFECHIPDSLVLNRRFRNAATMEWVEQADNSVVQLSVTAPGGDPDSGNLITARNHDYHTFTGIDPDSAYEVYARAWCDYSQMWSAWTEPVYVAAFNGIDSPEGGPAFTLVPNPARGSVTLTLEGEAALPATVTVLDLQGRELRRETLRSSTHVLGLQGLPPATYILRLDTPQGSSSRKLTVE